jgi:adenine-specific DNA-methyltransferase
MPQLDLLDFADLESGSLAKDYSNFEYRFPEPQYLGAKYTHLEWIRKFIPQGSKRAIDGFAGSHSVAFLLKQMGIETISNDYLNFNNQIGVALIQNQGVKLNAEDLKVLFDENVDSSSHSLIQSNYSNLFFLSEEAAFLDRFRFNVERITCEYKRALAICVMNRSMTRKITMGHFAHTQALIYASNPERVKRNKSLIRPLREIFNEILPSYNQAVFSNGKLNQSHNSNILDLIPNLPDVDLVYFDPPYCGSHSDYQGFYHLLETYTEYWRDKSFINSIRRYEPQRYSGFDKKSSALASFEKLFEVSENIPTWLISYNDRSFPSITDFEKIISKYREVVVESKTYEAGRGGKGSVAGSKEILFVCTPKRFY